MSEMEPAQAPAAPTPEPSAQMATLEAPQPVPALRARSLAKAYGGHWALREVSFDIWEGEVCGLVGPNGAGKSTLMSIFATLLTATRGTSEVFGVPTDRVAEIRPRVGYVPDVLGLYTDVTAEEYLHFFAHAYDVPAEDRPALVDGLLELVDLESKRHADLSSLSRGMKQRIGLARGLINSPQVLLLDEPASGLDPHARIELREIVAHLRAQGTTIIISSHILSELEEMCTQMLILEQGTLVGHEALHDAPATIRVRVTFLDGAVTEHEVASPADQAALVRQLVNEGRDVLSVEHVTVGLEERFMNLTRGDTN